MTQAVTTNAHYPIVMEEVIGEISQRVVSGRDLHRALKVATAFRDWMARRVADYGFAEGSDFRSFLRETRGRPAREYHLSLDMAKELAMVERTEQGRVIRRYFIECERQVAENAEDDARLGEELNRLYGDRLKPSTAWAPPRVNASAPAEPEKMFSLPEAAKILCVPLRRLMTWLRDNYWLITGKEPDSLEPLHYRVSDRDLVEVASKGAVLSRIMLTARGLSKLANYILPSRRKATVGISEGTGHAGRGFFVARRKCWPAAASYIVVMVMPTLWHGTTMHMVHEPGRPTPTMLSEWHIRNKVVGLEDATAEHVMISRERQDKIAAA